MSHLQPIAARNRAKLEQLIAEARAKRAQLNDMAREARAARTRTTALVTTHHVPDKAILDRIGTMLKAERFICEIIVDFRTRKEVTTRKNLEALFTSFDSNDNLDIAKRLVHFKDCYLKSQQTLQNICDLEEGATSLYNHITGYMKMKLAFLGIDKDFKEQYESGNWVLPEYESPCLPPEAFLRADIVKSMDLQTCNIVELPPNIGLWRNITYLDVNNTFISTLPREIGELWLLEYLDISNCRNLKSLPLEITKLENLLVMIFVSDDEDETHDVKKCFTNHKCRQNICTILFQDLHISQQKWLRNLKLNRCKIKGLHIGQIKK